jgi:DNA-binding beta-propeller fold protein YncE
LAQAIISSGNKVTGIVLTGLLLMITGVALWIGTGRKTAGGWDRKSAGHAQLISVQPLAETVGEICQWAPASAGSSLVAALEQRQAALEAAPSEAARAAAAKRQPVRMVRDPYSAFSAVAVDPAHNEVVMTDENLFGIVAYDRLENTPPKAAMSEPKRIIRGIKTDIEFQCSLYVDPANGDIYAVNNDTLGKLVIFSHGAQGDVAPDRFFEPPHTTYGIAVDEKNQEMLLTIQDDAAVVAFRKTAQGRDAPLRTLQGERTLLADPHGIALDSKRDLLFVSNWGSVSVHKPPQSGALMQSLGRGIARANWPVGRIYSVPGSGKFMPPSVTVYPSEASGDTAPLRVIQGPKTQLNWPTALAIDPERGELYVANDPTHSILVFQSDASGDAAPIRVLRGPKTLIENPTDLYLDLKNDELWVANFGNHTVTAYKRTAAGDTPPLRVIRSGPPQAPAPMMGNPFTVTYDKKRDELLVAN